jgi:hypothetical protein
MKKISKICKGLKIKIPGFNMVELFMVFVIISLFYGVIFKIKNNVEKKAIFSIYSPIIEMGMNYKDDKLEINEKGDIMTNDKNLQELLSQKNIQFNK